MFAIVVGSIGFMSVVGGTGYLLGKGIASPLDALMGAGSVASGIAAVGLPLFYTVMSGMARNGASESARTKFRRSLWYVLWIAGWTVMGSLYWAPYPHFNIRLYAGAAALTAIGLSYFGALSH
jgi:hypothetical protein